MKSITCTTLNLAKEANYSFLINYLGGEERVKQYKEVYTCINKIREYNKQGEEPDRTLLEQNEDTAELVNAIYFPGIHYERETGRLTVYYAVSLTQIPQSLFMAFRIYDGQGIVLAEKEIDKSEQKQFYTDRVSILRPEFVGQETLTIEFIVMAIYEEKPLSVTVLSSTIDGSFTKSSHTNTPFISRALVKAPKKNWDLPDEKLPDGTVQNIRAFYNCYPFRTQERDVDYVYDNAYDVKTGIISVKLEGAGSIGLSEKCKKEHIVAEPDFAIMDFGCGAVKYKSEDFGAEIRNGNLHWLFRSNWGTFVDTSCCLANTVANLTYTISLCEDGKAYSDSLFLSSLLQRDIGYNCRRLRKLQVIMGCVAEGTRIMLADGGQKKIEEIQIGEKVRAGVNGENGIVENVWCGNEQEIYCLETADRHMLYLTGQHSVYTDAGVQKAEKLKQGIGILMEDGSYNKLVSSSHYEKQVRVYNLDIELRSGQHGCMVCEGMMLTDNDYSEEGKTSEMPADNSNQRLISELKMLLKEKSSTRQETGNDSRGRLW